MKKFISWWMGLAVASAAVAIDFYIAIHNNQNPNSEQEFLACFYVAFFTILSLVSVGAHIENICNKKED